MGRCAWIHLPLHGWVCVCNMPMQQWTVPACIAYFKAYTVQFTEQCATPFAGNNVYGSCNNPQKEVMLKVCQGAKCTMLDAWNG